MRKKGILVTIGIVLTLAVYVAIGVIYFYPNLFEQKEVVTKKVTLPKAKVEEKVVPAAKVEPTPVKTPVVAPPVVEPIPVVEKPVVTPPAPVVEKPVVTPPVVEVVPVVEKPVVVAEKEIPSEVKVELPAVIEVVGEKPVVKVEDETRAFVRVVPTVEIGWTPPQIVPTLSRDFSAALPAFTPRVVPEVAEVVEEVKERVFQRIQPTIDLPPYEKHTEPTLYRAEVAEPLFKAPEPIELFWIPPQVAEEPRYVSIPTFLAEAQKARQEAIDAIFDKLIWP